MLLDGTCQLRGVGCRKSLTTVTEILLHTGSQQIVPFLHVFILLSWRRDTLPFGYALSIGCLQHVDATRVGSGRRAVCPATRL